MSTKNQRPFMFKDFSRGLMLYSDSVFTPVNLSTAQLLLCQNAYWRGGLQIRKGSRKVTTDTISNSSPLTSLHRFYRSGVIPQLLGTANGIISRLDGNTWTELKTGVIGENIFFTTYGPLTKVYIADGTTTPQQYDGTTISDYSVAPTNAKQFINHRDRIFSYSEGLNIEYSNNLDPDTWEVAAITLTSADPTITYIVKHSQSVSDSSVVAQLLIFTANNIWMLVGVNFVNLTDVYLHEVNTYVGTLSPKSVVRTPIGVIFLGREKGRNNIYVVSGMGLSTMVLPIGNTIRQLLSKIAESALSEVTAEYYDGYYRLYIRPPGGTQNIISYWLNIDNFTELGPTWFGPMIHAVGIRSMITLSGFGDSNQLYAGGENGLLYELDQGFNDDGTNIDINILTGLHDYDLPVNEKTIINVFTNIQSSGGIANISVNADFQNEADEETKILSLTSVGGSFPYTFPFIFPGIATDLKVLNFCSEEIRGIYYGLRVTFSETNENFLLNSIGLSFDVDDEEKQESA